MLKTIQPAPVTQVPQPTSTPSPEPQAINNQQSAIDTSDWQTYRNEGPSLSGATEPQGEFGFEVRYPGEWNVTGKRENIRIFGEEHTIAEEKCKQNEQKLLESGVNFGPTGCRFGIFMTILREEDIVQQYDVWTPYILPSIKEAFMLNRDYLAPHFAVAVPLQFNKDKYILIEFYFTEVNLSQQNKELVDQILSTFRFVE